MNELKHLACIMDGNRRWAEKNGLSRDAGHREGLETVKRVIEFCLKDNIKFLSLFAFSSENFNRPDSEKAFLFGKLIYTAREHFLKLVEHGVKVRFIGMKSLFSKSVQKVCDEVEQKTAHCDKLQVNLLFGYGSRMEIVEAAKKIAKDIFDKKVEEKDISEESFRKYLWTNGTPDPEIIVRPGFVTRISNFLLYQGAYSEFYFPKCLWPEVNEVVLREIIDDYKGCTRNFGF